MLSIALGLPMARISLVARYTTIAAHAWLLWDWLIQLEEEINVVWCRKMSASKALYIFTRYFGLALMMFESVSESRRWSAKFCHAYFYVMGIGSCLLVLIVEVGMQFRVYALYNCSKRVSYINSALFLLVVATLSTLLGFDIALQSHPIPTPDFHNLLTGCWNMERPRFTFVTWIIALTYELYLFVLVTYKAYGKYARLGAVAGIFKVMFRDAVIWFVFIAGLIGWNAFSWFSADLGYVFLGIPFLHAGVCIGGCRLLLNLNKAFYRSEKYTIFIDVASKARQDQDGQSYELRTIGSSVLHPRGNHINNITTAPSFITSQPYRLNMPSPLRFDLERTETDTSATSTHIDYSSNVWDGGSPTRDAWGKWVQSTGSLTV